MKISKVLLDDAILEVFVNLDSFFNSIAFCHLSPLNVLEGVRPFLKSLAPTEFFACLLVCVFVSICCSVGHPVARGRAFYT